MTPKKRRPEWWSLLACPTPKSRLLDHGEQLQCTACVADFATSAAVAGAS